jgi:hypothetical protein
VSDYETRDILEPQERFIETGYVNTLFVYFVPFVYFVFPNESENVFLTGAVIFK